MKDTIYRQTDSAIKPFEFDQRVVDVFPDMIKRSVPGYPMTVAMISVLADRYFQNNTNIYDLGCSLGAVVFTLASGLPGKQGQIIGVDNSAAMIAACEQKTAGLETPFDLQFFHDDINACAINNASVVVMNFTLQFISLAQREALLKKIYDGLLPGGVLIVSEKIAFDNEGESTLMQELHHHMKALNGYDEMEIANKREALEKVLLPETLPVHLTRLQHVGFKEVSTWLRCLNFISLIAFK